MKRKFLWGVGLSLAALATSNVAKAQYSIGPSDNGQFQSLYQPASFPVPNAGLNQVSTQGYNAVPARHNGWIGPSQNQLRLAQAPTHQHLPAPAAPATPTPMPAPAMPTPMAAPNMAAPNVGAALGSAIPAQHAPGCACTSCAHGGAVGIAPQGLGSSVYGTPIYGNEQTCGTAIPYGQVYQANPYAQAFGFPTGKVRKFGGSASHWFLGAGALVFNRVDDRKIRLTNDSAMPTNAYLSTRDARAQAAGGVQFTLGKYFNCGRNAIAATYWGLFPNERMREVMPPTGGNLRSELSFTDLGPGGAAATLHGIQMPGQSVYDWYDGAAAHRVRRDYEVHNFEISLLGFGLGGAAVAPGVVGNCQQCLGGPGSALNANPCSRLRMGWSAGIRWFRFRDDLEYATSETDTVFNYGTDDFFYSNDVRNDLVGFQLGSLLTYAATCRANLYLAPRAGIYGNRMRYETYAGTATQAATVVSAGHDYDGSAFDYTFTRTDFAFLGELDAGLAFRITKCWSANVGYRVLGASGVATAVGQIPINFANINDISHINNDSGLILHGAYFGATCNF